MRVRLLGAILLLAAVVPAILAPGAAEAAFTVINVSNDTELQDAFTTINGNPSQDYDVRIAPGTYNPLSTLEVNGDATRCVKIRRFPNIGAAPVVLDGLLITRIFNFVSGCIDVTQVVIQNGIADDSGAAALIGSNAKVKFKRCSILNNVSAIAGGAIHVYQGGELELSRCEMALNSAGDPNNPGAAILNEGKTTIKRSTIDGNTMAEGTIASMPFIFPEATPFLFLDQSTVTNNGLDAPPLVARAAGPTTGQGAAILNDGTATITNSTISHNQDQGAAGGLSAIGGTITVRNTIVANNSGGNCNEAGGDIVSNGHNLENTNTCGFTLATDKRNTPAGLGPLQNNGGGIPTRLPGPTSAAIDTGGGTGPLDQRGMSRPQGLKRDRGAVEVGFCFGERETKVGTDEANTLNGTTGVDVMFGLGGNDKLVGKAGNDRLCGDAGTDQLRGDAGGGDKCNGGPPATGDTQTGCETTVNIP
ncbi:MAG: choice-of-anchor Q domain-containing protein [Dehalococcoidia bacterium]